MTAVKLTPSQQQAVEYDGGPLIVLAGPGTGKTRVIVHRVAHMMSHRGIDPERVAALTFTNKAAGELRERLGEIVGGARADAMSAGTFHSFGFNLLRRFADLAGLSPNPQLLDSAQQRRLWRALIAEHGLFQNTMSIGLEAILADARTTIDACRSAGLVPRVALTRLDAALQQPSLEDGPRAEFIRLREHLQLFKHFDEQCIKRGLLAVDDLITRPTHLLRTHDMVRSICQHDYAHLVVDEFQDLNRSQIELLAALCGTGEPDICVVGDDDQAIYGFRGADQFAFEHFRAHWPNAEQVVLSENWRSGQAVVSVANAIIGESETRYAPDKIVVVAPDREAAPGSVEAVELDRAVDDGDVIAAMILLDRERTPDRPWSDYAVIVRTHKDSTRVEAALQLEGIPTITTRAQPVAENPGVLDLIAWINTALEPDQAWSVRRILTRPPFSVDPYVVSRIDRAYRAAVSRLAEHDTPKPFVDWLVDHYAEDADLGPHVSRLADLARLFRESAHTESADATIQRIITSAGLTNADLPDAKARTERIEALVTVLRFARERLDRLEQPRDLAAFMRYHSDLDDKEQGFTTRIEEVVDGPENDSTIDGDGVRLLTAHAAKGLEFDTVFLPRVESPHGYPRLSGSKPFTLPAELTGDKDQPEPIEEERRIFYVACTRAQRRLVTLGKRVNKPGPTSFQGFLLRSGLVTQTDGQQQMEQAADAGLGRFEKGTSPTRLTDMRSTTRRDVLARARQRVRSEAALALDAADRSTLDEANLNILGERLHTTARRMMTIATLAAGRGVPSGLDAETVAFARTLEADLAASEAVSSGFGFRPPTPPLSLSYTTLNTYLRCPRCYYVKYVMGLPEAERQRSKVGSVTHEALQKFVEAWRKAESEGRSPPEIDALIALGRSTLKMSIEPDEPIDADVLTQLEAQLRVYAERLHNPADEPIEVEKSVLLHYPHAGYTHQITAKIDRIDRTANGIRIIDYKTGAASKRLLEPKKSDLQLGLYAMAAQKLYDDPDVAGTAEYWVLSTGERGILDFAQINTDKIHAAICTAIDGILNGLFPRGRECYRDCEILDAAIPNA